MEKLLRDMAMRTKLFRVALLIAAALPAAAHAQATTRPCGVAEQAGPACLLASKDLAGLPKGQVFWHIDRFASIEDAERAGTPTSNVVQAFGSTWLFTLANKEWRSRGGEHLSSVGPLPIVAAPGYSAEYIRSIFAPGTTAPLHVHSGPEAFYAVSGDTCLETSDGVQTGRGPGNSLIIMAGPPMLLMAIGKVPRQGFALILHDSSRPPTTLTQMWHPSGLCARLLATDQAQ
jgi:quercetin dioxygenase-like cupin family protein